MKTYALTVTLLGLISFGASAAQYDRDDNISDRHAKELRLKAFEGKPSYQVKVNPLMSVDRDEPVSTRRATELRQQALGESVHNNIEQFTQRDRDEKVSTLHATKLRLKAFEDDSFDMDKVGQTGGYDFSHDSVIDDANSHYRNHR